MDEQTIIVGRPTYVAVFSGRHEAAPIVEKLTAGGYPQDDIAVLLRPAGTDAVVDLLSGENAAGQDANVSAILAREKGKQAAEETKTFVILHPEPAQLDAVRAGLRELGAQEYEYEPETVYSGADSEADVSRETALGSAQGMGGDVQSARKSGAPAGAGGSVKPGHFTPPPNDATADTAGTPTTTQGGAAAPADSPAGGTAGSSTAAGSATPPAASSAAAASPETALSTAPEPNPARMDKLQGEIEDLKRRVDDTREELEKADQG